MSEGKQTNMATIIFYAVIFITAALIFYTIGVWSERYSKRLKTWHVVLFWLGLVADIIGTGQMKVYAGQLELNLHTVLGLIGLMLMFLHTLWATKVVFSRNELAITRFHRFSVPVWFAWFAAYASGVAKGIQSI